MDRSPAAFSSLVDLAAEEIGGRAVAANDEFFAGKENLLKPGRGVFDPDRYTERGKWMDGWETRRRRTPGHDWCVVRLGVPGAIRAVDVDTNHFLGNYPAEASIDACHSDEATGDDPDAWPWRPLVARSLLRPGSQNLVAIANDETWDVVRLNIFPDGGVARLRVWGEPRPAIPADQVFDLAALVHGGRAVACSDMFFGRMGHLILPNPPTNMGGGWETQRRRGPGHDWVVIHLAAPAVLERIEVDTMHFKGNYPDRCSIDGCAAGDVLGMSDCHDAAWRSLVEETPLGPDQTHTIADLAEHAPIDHIRLNIFPDGGVARLRAWGRAVTPEVDR
ncbi:MAG: allantoicase [Acidobacteriota bacterium]